MLPVGVDHRMEFMTRCWIEARACFVRDRAPRTNFTLCELFTDAPPGIHGSLWLRVENGRVQAGESQLDGADVQVSGDYQSALAMAQTPDAEGPEAVARAEREPAYGAGQTTRAFSGQPSAELTALRQSLHDHMPARTMENPNLTHRRTRLGLNRQAQGLADLGFTVVERAIWPAYTDELSAHPTGRPAL
jgi:hypothetical protein